MKDSKYVYLLPSIKYLTMSCPRLMLLSILYLYLAEMEHSLVEKSFIFKSGAKILTLLCKICILKIN